MRTLLTCVGLDSIEDTVVKITVHFDSKQHCYAVDVMVTVQRFKNNLYKENLVPLSPDNQCVRFQDNILTDEQHLHECGIRQGSEVYINKKEDNYEEDHGADSGAVQTSEVGKKEGLSGSTSEVPALEVSEQEAVVPTDIDPHLVDTTMTVEESELLVETERALTTSTGDDPTGRTEGNMVEVDIHQKGDHLYTNGTFSELNNHSYRKNTVPVLQTTFSNHNIMKTCGIQSNFTMNQYANQHMSIQKPTVVLSEDKPKKTHAMQDAKYRQKSKKVFGKSSSQPPTANVLNKLIQCWLEQKNIDPAILQDILGKRNKKLSQAYNTLLFNSENIRGSWMPLFAELFGIKKHHLSKMDSLYTYLAKEVIRQSVASSYEHYMPQTFDEQNTINTQSPMTQFINK